MEKLIREVLKSGSIWSIGDGAAVRVYQDNWFRNSCSLKVLSPPLLGEQTHVAELLYASGGWNAPLIKSALSPYVVEIISSIPNGGLAYNDRLAWHFTNSCVYLSRLLGSS